MQDNANKFGAPDQNTGQKLQQAIGDDLFPKVANISDVKQVIDVMKTTSQNLKEPQMKALIKLERLGDNSYIHGEKNPYKDIIKYIKGQGKTDVANPEYYLDVIESLIPKPPKPIIMAEKGMKR